MKQEMIDAFQAVANQFGNFSVTTPEVAEVVAVAEIPAVPAVEAVAAIPSETVEFVSA